MNITTKTNINLTKLYFNNILHIAFVRKDFQALTSWKDFDKYSIQLTFKDGASILVEYNDVRTWTMVLKELEGVLYP